MKGLLYEACPGMVLETAIVRELYCHYSKKGHWKRIKDSINDGLHIRNLSIQQRTLNIIPLGVWCRCDGVNIV